jgi:hypothetical protein
MRGEAGGISAAGKLALKASQCTMQPVYVANVHPSVEPWRETDQGDQHRDDRHHKEHDAVQERGEPE